MDVASRTFSIYFVEILCNSRLAFLTIRFVIVHVRYPSSRIDITTTWKKLLFILLNRSDFHMIENLSIAVHAFTRHILMSSCYWGRWTCPLISENHHFVWRCWGMLCNFILRRAINKRQTNLFLICCPVSWGCRIHWLHLCRGVGTPPPKRVS